MEYVFEDFVFGFIEKEIEAVTAKAQRSDTHLDEGKTFKLKPDLFLETDAEALIADTKYKIVYSDDSDPKKGISQADLYQMLAYAVRFEVNKIILFYPNTIEQHQENSTEFTIRDALANGQKIVIKAFQLPVINRNLLEKELATKTDLNELFESTKEELKEKLEKILVPTIDIELADSVNNFGIDFGVHL